MVKCIWIAINFFFPLGRLLATVAARATAGATRIVAGRLHQVAAIETNGILTYMLLFSPSCVGLEATSAIYEECKVLDMLYRVQMNQPTAKYNKCRCQRQPGERQYPF